MSVISTMSYDFLYLKYIQIGGTVDNPDYKDHFELGGALEQTGYTHLRTGVDVPFITV